MNLAVNARDAMPTGGKLIIETTVLDLSPEEASKRPPAEPGDYVQVTVSDTGTGMGPETKGRIFEPFFTTKDVDKGTGLGLAVVYGIVTHSGGHIQVDSELDLGTRFTVRLPKAAATALPAQAKPEEAWNVRGDETILLVEDEERLCKLVELVLTENGYHVLTAHNGSEALELARKYRGKIDLLLTDVVMPQMRGSELARKLLVDRPALRVLFMSGYVDEAQKPELLVRGDFIQKPFVTAHLSRRVRELLDRTRSVRPKPAE
jgi:CheY-like chemotaxis protein